MTTFVNPFTGDTINPTQVGYQALSISTSTELQWPINGNTGDVVASIIEVIATVAGLNLLLPPATQVSTGQSLLVKNVGSEVFTVTNNNGGTIIAIQPGIAQYIYLTDNSTIDGAWSTVTFGAGTSSADAASLAGYGLTALSTTLNQAYNIVEYFSDVTLDQSNRAQFVVWTSGVGTITLPSASLVGNNWFCIIRNNGSGILTIDPQGTSTINSDANLQLQLTDSAVICCDGSDFFTFGLGRASEFVFTLLVKNVTGGTVTLSAAEGANVIQEYSGVLTSDCEVVLPSTVQIYALSNATTGPFNLTFKTAAVGGATLTVAQSQTAVAICDGTNVYNAQTTPSSTLVSLTLGNGSSANPSLNFTGNPTTGVYLPASNQLGFTLNGVNAATLRTDGFRIPVGISGGAF